MQKNRRYEQAVQSHSGARRHDTHQYHRETMRQETKPGSVVAAGRQEARVLGNVSRSASAVKSVPAACSMFRTRR